MMQKIIFKEDEDCMDMPDFTSRLETVSKHRYKIKFLNDGYPGKDLGGTIACHPIYGIYVIRDYLFQYKKTKDVKYQNAAIQVADAAINRMRRFKNSLVFWYKTTSVFNPTSKDYYSGLTQSYYAEVMAQLYATTNMEKYKEAAQKMYNSLKIPVLDGGVFHNSTKGPSIQEYPMAPNGYVLNGWLSAISSVKKYGELLQCDDAADFWRENLNTICCLLPLYDAPSFVNSRYTLNGDTTIRVDVTPSNVELQEVRLHVPGEGTFELSVDSNKIYANYIDANYVVKKGEKYFTKNYSAIFRVLLSRFSYPEENAISIKMVSSGVGMLKLSMSQPIYSPTNQMTKKNTFIKKIPIQKGENTVKIKLPWKHLKALATPTTFKQLGYKWHNIYHFIHINRLEEFYKITKDKRLLEYINKWKKYVDLWDDNPLYKELETEPYKGE